MMDAGNRDRWSVVLFVMVVLLAPVIAALLLR